jgi:opacity protein-like surface antigen
MGRKFWAGSGVFALIVAGTGAAGAADLALKAPPLVKPPVVYWGGFYLGIHGGFGWGDTSFDSAPFPNASPKGGVFGGQAGYNWQYGSIVGGLEVDFSGADIKNSSTYTTAATTTTAVTVTTPEGPCKEPVTTTKYVTQTTYTNHTRDFKIDDLSSSRGRVGYTVLPSLLAYGTAGLGWSQSSLTVDGASSDADKFGWVAGAGLEYKVWGNFIARAEYLHYDFGKVTYGDGFVGKTAVDVARGGLSYKF